MASPTPPILSSLIIEALRRSGYTNPVASLQARAQERWIEEIKAEIWTRSRTLKSLQTKGVTILTKGLSQYTNPSDYAADMKMTFVTGARYGTAQGGSVTTVTLATSDTATEADTIGKEVIITSGTGLGGIATISAFNVGTKVATFAPAVTTAPILGSGYMLIDDYRPLNPLPVWQQADMRVRSDRGYPAIYFPIGDGSNGQFILSPMPWREDSQTMAVIQNYQADLTEADTVGTLMLTLYQKWQPMWISGIRWKCLQNDDDERAASAFQEFQKAMRDVIRADSYGNTLSELQARVMDY